MNRQGKCTIGSRLHAAIARAALLLLLAASAVPARAADWTYTVQPGDNPWNLTERFLAGLKYWPRIQALNNIVDPLHIPPGTRLRIPIAWLRPVPADARVVAIVGRAERIAAGRTSPADLAEGAVLKAGDVVRTAPESNVTIEFQDGSRMLVHADSELRLANLTAYQNTGMFDTRLHLERGRSENLAMPRRGDATRFEISTPAAVTAVRGTRWRVASADDAARTEVLEGVIDARTSVASMKVSAGFGTVAAAAAAPGKPVALLPAPDLSALPEVIERVPMGVAIPALTGAVAYRLQVARDPRFAPIAFDARSGSTTLRGPDLPDGDYLLRVRGIDANGLEGLNADRPVKLNARPEPPLLTAPAPGAGVVEDKPRFQWAVSDTIDHYRFQIGADPEFKQILMDADGIKGGTVEADRVLEIGRYYWRVAAFDAAEGAGPFSDPQEFRRPPPGPAAEPPAIDKDTLTVRWRAGLPGQQFQFQLAKSADFASPLVDQRTAEAQAAIARPPGGRWYLRVRSIDPDGFEGPYGTTQQIDLPSRHKPWWLLLGLIGLAL
ncbi:MAG: FecR domain-containing protein [Gammaproteobacteria bacterium]